MSVDIMVDLSLWKPNPNTSISQVEVFVCLGNMSTGPARLLGFLI